MKKKESYRVHERLVHFSCGSCCKWFSIGDAPKDRSTYYCPWCGEQGEFSLRKGMDLENKQEEGEKR